MAGRGSERTGFSGARTKILVAVVASLGALVLAGNALAGGPTVTSDQGDYGPGSLVTITGSGWPANDLLKVQTDDSVGQTWSDTGYPMTDASGDFVYTVTLPSYFIASYTTTASDANGLSASATFTDAAVQVVGVGAPTGTFSFNVHVTGYSDSGCASNAGPGTTLPFTTSQNAIGNSTGTKDANGKNANSFLLHESGNSSDGRSFSGWNAGGTSDICVAVPSGSNVTETAHFGAAPPANHAPAASAGGPYSGTEGAATSLDGSGSSDPDAGDVLTYAWSYAANAGTTGTCSFSSAAVQNPTITCTDNGSYTVSLVVTDNHDATSAASNAALTVANVAPTVTAAPGQSATINASQSFGLGSFSDPGSDSPWAVDVDWGDGSGHTQFNMTGSGAASGTTVTAQSHTYMSASGPYTVTVKVTDKDGSSDTKTFQVTVNKLTQDALSVETPSSGIYGEKLTPTATGGSGGGAVTFTASGTACAMGTGDDAGKLLITSGAGTCAITAHKAADSTYKAADSASQTVSVGPATLSLNATNAETVYGTAGSLDYTLSGFVNGEDASSAGVSGSGSCSVSGSQAVGTHAGAITCAPGTLAAPNYVLATGSAGDLTVDPATLSVNAKPASKVYGQADPWFESTLSGFVNGEDASSAGVTGTAACSRASGESVAGGPYAITCAAGSLAAANYVFATGSTASLTITPHDLGVAADPQSKVYGAADPALTYTVTAADLQFGDTAAGVLSGSLARVAGESVDGGPYAITVGTLAANDNYALEFTGSTLTITPHDLRVAADPRTKVYGAGDPALTYTVTAADLQFGDTAAGVLSGSLARVAGESVDGGPYAISVGTLAANDNYVLKFTGSSLTVTPRQLTVTAADQTMTLNGAVPTLTTVITGFAFSETLATSGVTGSASCSTAAGTSVGQFPIVCAQGTLDGGHNYEFVAGPPPTGSFVNGTLKVAYATTNCLGSAGHAILQPVNSDGSSVFKQGSTVPAKFRVCDANGSSIGAPGVVSDFKLVQRISGTDLTSVNESVDSTTPDTAFRWSSTDQQWIYNVSTKSLPKSVTYVYSITLNDGSTITFKFGLR